MSYIFSDSLAATLKQDQLHHTINGVIEAVDPFLIRDYLAKIESKNQCPTLLYILPDDTKRLQVESLLAYTCPNATLCVFPAWDCLPYDRVSPRKDIVGQRLKALQMLLAKRSSPLIVLITPSAFLQKLPPKDSFVDETLCLSAGDTQNLDHIVNYLSEKGYDRVSTVREPGEFAVRGGIVDIYPFTDELPYRLDFFGDEIESIKSFDPLSQRSEESVDKLELGVTRELKMTPATVSRFRTDYRERFSHNIHQDPLYKAVSDHKSYPGIEHWTPLFYEHMDTLLDYIKAGEQDLSNVHILLGDGTEKAMDDRLELIQDHFQARKDFRQDSRQDFGAPQPASQKATHFSKKNSKQLSHSGNETLSYNPLEPDELYISKEALPELLKPYQKVSFAAFSAKDEDNSVKVKPLSILKKQKDENQIECLKAYLEQETKSGKRVHVFCQSQGSRHHLIDALQDKAFLKTQAVDTLEEGHKQKAKLVSFHVCPLHQGFESDKAIYLSEREIYGEIQKKVPKKSKRSDLFIAEASSLQPGDYVVHDEHGIGQFDGLVTMTVDNIPHDCVKLLYHGGDKLFLPAENIELISRYGGEDTNAVLDKLGSVAWQARRAKVKKRLEDIADHLIEVAASRKVKRADVFQPDLSLYSEFVHRFPFTETDDQLNAISDVMDDLQKGQPMDRLICGDVGFGKTEVAMRAAFIVAATGKQVALVTPTTLLARQHYLNFKARFEGFGLKVAQLSRIVTPKAAKTVKEELQNGQVDIVIGTHALLAESVKFKDLALVIVDEEQHFGVKQKEKLKALQRDIHVLTLTATPIPRTLQLSLTGVRDLSIIATPPIDRLTIRTFVTPYDPVTIQEAIRRELNRNGQVFYVSPRLKDLQGLMDDLLKIDPSYRIAVAHGQMPARDLETVMDDFAAHKYDILLSTNIIESGIDLPTVNTLFVHRADHFGLSQLYQLRGRIGRGKLRAYAYLTLPTDRILTKNATKRLEVMQTLDSLGAGFQIASHDMDIRGAGNLLGQEQSGHVKEVGVELYQHLLEEAVETAHKKKEQQQGADKNESYEDTSWSPVLNLGVAVMIPDSYVSDLSIRMDLYRRLAHFSSQEEIDDMSRELIDRFGAYPQEVENVLKIIGLKQIAKRAGIAKIDVGAKGVVLKFHKNQVKNPEALLVYIQNQRGLAKLRPDHSVFFSKSWTNLEQKFKGCKALLTDIETL